MLEQAVAYIRAGEIEKARSFLIEVLKQNPSNEDAWLWMTKCVVETEQKRYCLERVLKINPQNQYAIRGLRHLTKPVSPPTQPELIEQEPVRPVPTRGFGDALLNIALFGIAVFLVLLFLYAWWLAR
jgi:tetratricopeptide (TPR) repeat protein